MTWSKIKAVNEIFSAEEIDKIYQFCRNIGLEVGELDMLRDRSDSKVYIVDANKTSNFLSGYIRFDRFMLAYQGARRLQQYLKLRRRSGPVPPGARHDLGGLSVHPPQRALDGDRQLG